MNPILKYKNKDLFIRLDEYTINGRLYLALVDKNGELWDDITKNLLDIPVADNIIFINPNIPKNVVKKLYDSGVIINLYDSQKCNMGYYDKAYVNMKELDKYLNKTFFINIYVSESNYKNKYYKQDTKIFDDIEDAIQYSRGNFKEYNYYKIEVVDYKGEVYFDKQKNIEDFYINGLKVVFVSQEILSKYLNNWGDKKELPIDESLIFTKEGNTYIGVDNSTGDCWTEDFDNEKDVIKWLIGVDKEVIRGDIENAL